MLYMLITSAATDPSGILLQYGALGVLTLCAVIAVRVMYQSEVAAHEREKERADRLESELRQLNEMIRSDYISTIGNATRAIADANEAVTNALTAVRRDAHG